MSTETAESGIHEQVRRRRLERHCAATLRALSAHPGVEYRRQQLILDGHTEQPLVPHLGVDMGRDALDRCRGVTDSLAMHLAFTDRELHRDLMPEDPLEQLVFDLLEQLRVESLVPDVLPGVKQNIDQAFTAWCRECRADGLVENEVGLLIYTVAHMMRLRFGGEIRDEEAEGLIEAPRFQLAPMIGEELSEMGRVRHDQRAFGQLALSIAGKVGEIVRGDDGDTVDRYIAALRTRSRLPLPMPADDRFSDDPDTVADHVFREMEADSSYRVFCTDHDREVNGRDLYRIEQRRELRKRLDRMVAAQAVSVTRLAQRLQRLFGVDQRAGWHDGEEEGYIDGRRLSQVVSRPGFSRAFKQERQVPTCDTVLSFLIDNSGSMKRQRFEAVAVLLDILCRALELAGISTEVLGFTTRGWTGGQSILEWRAAGSPDNPGRLNDRLHIVYKDADTSWRRSRYAISAMLNPLHFREGLDGEALAWAAWRLLKRPEARKGIVMISDGAPMDSASSNYNEPYFLERHLRDVASQIERSGEIELKAIGIGLDMDEFFSQSVNLDLTGTLDKSAFGVLETLFARYPRVPGADLG